MDERRLLWVGLLAATLGLAGCGTNKAKEREADLDWISRWLPGTYDNTVQAKSDVEKGVRPPHDAVAVAIVPVDSIAVGRNAFYVQEMAADDPRRVFSQRILLFKATDKGIVESIATLVDPLRWRDANRDPDIFTGMTPKDYNVVSGCDLTWKREGGEAAYKRPRDKEEAKRVAENRRFVGANDPATCKMTSHAAMGLVQVELRAELTSTEFEQGELQYDSAGKLLQGDKESPLYRFRKVGQ
ncbi:MAG TPA: chromophore lyase CpcT/CpeT [Steroidobacteraceae bacterium]|nr:chromophore lyase CpcT/CpeT [Steroidobacteraceae bacterium]